MYKSIHSPIQESIPRYTKKGAQLHVERNSTGFHVIESKRSQADNKMLCMLWSPPGYQRLAFVGSHLLLGVHDDFHTFFNISFAFKCSTEVSTRSLVPCRMIPTPRCLGVSSHQRTLLPYCNLLQTFFLTSHYKDCHSLRLS